MAKAEKKSEKLKIKDNKHGKDSFTARLLDWHRQINDRQMPWKGEKEPYKIWLSEIILQQTRVEQGLAYYEKFIRHYPTIKDLAAASPDKVFKDWEGLGYYTRCKNLLYTAKVITEDYKGLFPDNYEQILALKGIGPYTAAAICAFAYNQPYAVLDGNVFRVLSRIFGIHTPIDSTKGKEHFQQLAEEALSSDYPAIYNQAIMDFGATVCKPALPICGNCPMASICQAKQTAQISSLPKKEKILKKKIRHITWLILEIEQKTSYRSTSLSSAKASSCSNSLIYIQKRAAGDIWENLHEFYPIETSAIPNWTEGSLQAVIQDQLGVNIKRSGIQQLPSSTQQLTHQKIHGYYYKLQLEDRPANLPEVLWFTKKQINELAFPKLLKDLQIDSFQIHK